MWATSNKYYITESTWSTTITTTTTTAAAAAAATCNIKYLNYLWPMLYMDYITELLVASILH
jgi:hypothetical protein